jgi:type I restriction enzyme S subunit
MSFPRYPEYKDSGVDWLGEVPAEWSIMPLKTIASYNDDVLPESTDPDERIAYVDISSVDARAGIVAVEEMSFAAAPSRARRRVRHGDVIVSTVRTYLKAIAAIRNPRLDLVVSTGFAVVRPGPTVAGPFLGYLLSSQLFLDEVIARSTGVSFPAINASDLVSIKVVIPSFSEQFAIAEFLDRETAKIDALVAEQERLIALLQEKRQAVISHAVTKGLNPDAPMKDSGVEWLGEVPAHWSVISVRRVIRRIEQGWSPECFSRPAQSQEWGVVKAGCVNRGVFYADENKALPEGLDPRFELEIKVGDVLMSRASGSPDLVGSCSLVTAVRPRLMLSDKIFRIHTREIVSREFFVAVFNSALMRQQIGRAISGADGLANNLSQGALMAFCCVIPPQHEQDEITRAITSMSAETESLLDWMSHSIQVLQERRTALIAAATRGQIAVRGIATAEAA